MLTQTVPAFSARAIRCARAPSRVQTAGNPLVRDQPAAGGADLPLVAERRPERALERGVEVGVVEHDVRRLAAELERQPLEVPGGGALDLAADRRGAGERHLVDAV